MELTRQQLNDIQDLFVNAIDKFEDAKVRYEKNASLGSFEKLVYWDGQVEALRTVMEILGM